MNHKLAKVAQEEEEKGAQKRRSVLGRHQHNLMIMVHGRKLNYDMLLMVKVYV